MMRAKPVLLKLHRWLGLGLGIMFLLQGLTGTIVAFRPELNRIVHRDAMVVAPVATPGAALQALADAARAVNPAATLTRLDTPTFPDGVYFARLEHPTTRAVTLISLDPNTAQVLRQGGFGDWPIELAFEIHYELATGESGERVVGFVGFFILVMAVMGLLVWWPGLGGFKRAFAVKLSGGGYRAWRDLHRVGGTLIAAVLFFGATTGVGLAWKPWIQPLLASVTPMQNWPPKATAGTCAEILPTDVVVAAAQAHENNDKLRSVRFQGKRGALMTIHLHSKARPRSADRVLVDACTGAVLGAKDADDAPTGDVALDWLLPLHTGEWLGVSGRVLMLLMAIGLVGLGGSGYYLWSARNLKKKKA